MKKRQFAGYLFASPWVITFLVFWLFPLLFSLYLGFTDYKLLKPTYNWVGFGNFAALFSDQEFLTALKNTFIFVVGTIPFTTVIALTFALLLNKNFPGRTLFRSAYFMPSITSMVVIALIFTNLYSRGGYIFMLADMIGLSPPENGFLLSNRTALYAVMAMDVWMSVGYYMLLFLAGLKSIPEELYEAAEVAGADAARKFFSITLPLLKPVMLFIIVINTIKSFQVFVEIFVMTKGRYGSSTAVYFIYDTGLSRFEFGYASAAAYILFLIIAVFSLAQFGLLKQRGMQ
ncbi:MAG: sugar ABC transporter permease [candidate division Zixibacteria bacterium HGW-Zixibacteria-1]|nr:MAG: sugar ABC transporter permease [candidate division Zixibacteria bacterium HGW-Zixibacteria-1]